MAGAGMSVSAKGGRRPVDAAINLVPFIDLLSCCISFLLITAVWVNLGRMPEQTPHLIRYARTTIMHICSLNYLIDT
jgi:uncharacterized membrane protein